MTSTIESRLGVTPREAVKQPVLVATDGAITLSGTQTVNGIYLCQSGAWTRV